MNSYGFRKNILRGQTWSIGKSLQ